MSLFVFGGGGGGGGDLHISMFYMIGRRLNNCHFSLNSFYAYTCFFLFLSPMLSYFPVFFVVTGRCVDKGSPDR